MNSVANLFVYGTLMRCSGGELLDSVGAEFIGYGFVKGCLYDLDHFPAFQKGSYSTAVWGEVWSVPDYMFPILDEIEDVPNLYKRTEMGVWMPGQFRYCSCQLYEYVSYVPYSRYNKVGVWRGYISKYYNTTDQKRK